MKSGRYSSKWCGDGGLWHISADSHVASYGSKRGNSGRGADIAKATRLTHKRHWRRDYFFIFRLHLAPLAEARERASRVFVLALARATCATTPKRWRPKPGELRQAAIELLPIQISHRQPAGEALPQLGHRKCKLSRFYAFIDRFPQSTRSGKFRRWRIRVAAEIHPQHIVLATNDETTRFALHDTPLQRPST